MSAEIRDVNKQQKALGKIGDVTNHLNLIEEYLREDPWSRYLARDGYTSIFRTQAVPALDRHTMTDYCKLVSLIALLCAEYGFTHLVGGITRHTGKKWVKPYFDPRHQLAVATYMGLLNTQGYQLRSEVYMTLMKYEPRVAVGVWGVTKPVLEKDGNSVLDKQRVLAEDRLKRQQPISLPWVELHQRLSEVSFTSDDADRMPDSEFETQVLPVAKRALRDYLDLEKACEVFI